jgi:hypothetical protein
MVGLEILAQLRAFDSLVARYRNQYQKSKEAILLPCTV